MTSSSGTEDSTDEDEQDIFTLYPRLKSSLDITNNNAASVTTTTTVPPTNDNKKNDLILQVDSLGNTKKF
ncbi:unnamed protein product [Rotaria sp. Silwood2]|nr:unnamed protein product [Rotaria sp. Silwood2]